ncbi:uncharacterized protein [Spinacia oleracea]|uniref:Uncharacterized protein isoform X2 n=1 Tax=Spinacia oleracea TaxID=3562 RepID=A0ABM3RG98_SPIOL|nr:uncharacterized protein LOC110787386 isoform X2 [Spinacia oleracea]
MPMEANGQKLSNPGARLTILLTKREKLQDELRNIEKQVFELETTYLQDSNHFGHVLKGFEGFLGSTKSATKLKSRQVDVMMSVLDDQRVEAYLQMDRANQRREGWCHEGKRIQVVRCTDCKMKMMQCEVYSSCLVICFDLQSKYPFDVVH